MVTEVIGHDSYNGMLFQDLSHCRVVIRGNPRGEPLPLRSVRREVEQAPPRTTVAITVGNHGQPPVSPAAGSGQPLTV